MKISSLVYLIIPIFLSSCSHHYYIPNVQNVPLFREKNEFRVSVSGGTSMGNDSSTEVQAAYAITNCIGIMANYMNAKQDIIASEGSSTTLPNFGKENFIEGGIGYYKPLNKTQSFEIYGGYGSGSQSHQYVFNTYGGGVSGERAGTAGLSHYRLFIQPSWGFKTNVFELAFSTRFSDLFYNHFHFSNLYYDSDIDNSNYDLGAFVNKSHILIEPAMTMRLGWENVKFQFQYSYSAPIDSSDKKYIIKNHISLGFNFSFGKKAKTK